MTPSAAHKYIIETVKSFGGPAKFSKMHDISEGCVKAAIDPIRKLKPGPRMMKAVGLKKVVDGYVVEK